MTFPTVMQLQILETPGKYAGMHPNFTASSLRLSYPLKHYARPKLDISEFVGDLTVWARTTV